MVAEDVAFESADVHMPQVGMAIAEHLRAGLVTLWRARRCAALRVPDLRRERDALIVATALTHDLKVVTRNTGDFEPMGLCCSTLG